MTALANVTLGADAANVTFSSIASGYRDLVLVIRGNLTGATRWGIRFNGTASSYHVVTMSGNGSSASSTADGNAILGSLNEGFNLSTDSTQIVINIHDAFVSDKYKIWMARTNTAAALTQLSYGQWHNTAAVTSVTIVPGGYNLASGTSFALYGVSA
jgi:hypothetical protein